jgi:dipeptidyl aminopeptidase/acylaminoacyl peptidase
MSRRPLAFLLSAAALLAAVLGAISMGTPATAAAASPQCLTNLVANVFAGNPTVLPPAPCSDPDGDSLTIIVVGGPSHGTLSAQAADGTRTYTAEASYTGSDVVRFKANDGSSDSAVSTLTINVQPAPNGQQTVPPAPQPSNPVDSRRCVGRGLRQPKNGLMVAEEFRYPLRVFRPDGRGAERALTHPHHKQDLAPAFSPNGRKVAFERSNQIWTVDVGSGRERRVGAGSMPAWSSDGRWILLDGSPLTAIRPDGTGRRTVSASDRVYGSPSSSPNGRCVALNAYDDNEELGLAIMDSRGGDPHVILSYTGRFESTSRLSWSHDGRRLLFVGRAENSTHRSRIVRVNVDGSGMRLLTPFRDVTDAFYSPDGRTIAFTRRKVSHGAFTNSGGVYTMPAGGGRSHLVVPRRYAAAWGPRAR